MKYTDYQEYIKEQTVRAESKWGRKPQFNELFKKNLRQSWGRVKDIVGEPQSICCMGIRDGTEVFEFRKYCPNAEVYGVDITENVKTIKNQENIFVQDYNNLPSDWVDKFDLIFSNSLDHAYKPEETIKEWARVTKEDGHLFLELSTTPKNNIEHSFLVDDLDILSKDLEIQIWWATPQRNLISVLAKV